MSSVLPKAIGTDRTCMLDVVAGANHQPKRAGAGGFLRG
jgi:hypothetical protein